MIYLNHLNLLKLYAYKIIRDSPDKVRHKHGHTRFRSKRARAKGVIQRKVTLQQCH